LPKLLTIKEVAEKTGVSEYAVKSNVGELLAVLPVKERLVVVEYMFYCKQHTRIKGEEAIGKLAGAVVG